MTWRCCVLFSLLSSTLCSHALAQEPAPKFAFQMEIVVLEPERALQTLVLPVDVYESVQRTDLGDLRVLDADGRAVPHAIRTLTPPQRAPATLQAPHFPLYPRTDEQAQAQGQPWVIEAETSASGAIVRVKQAATNTQADANVEPPTPRAYLIDISATERMPEAIEIDLAAATEADVLMDVQVEASTDLASWVLVAHGTLAHLQHADRRIDRSRIELAESPSSYRYLRVQPTQPSADFVIERARVVVPPEQKPLEPMQLELPARIAKDRDTYAFDSQLGLEHPRVYIFDVPTPIAIDEVAWRLPQERTVVSATLYGLERSSTQREALWSGIAHSLGPVPQLNEPVALHGRHFSRLDLVVDPKGGGIGSTSTDMPRLQVRWKPQQLLFVARGKGPFTLVFGSVQAEPAAFEANELIRDPKDVPIEVAKLLGKVPRDGNAALRPVPKQSPASTKTYVLWAVLIAAVIATAVMALRVFRDRD